MFYRWIIGIIAGALFASMAAWASAQQLHVTSLPGVIFSSTTDGCDLSDIPDSSARAIRRADGTVMLVSTHYINRAMIGPDLDHLRHSCRIVFQGGENDLPDRFDDRAWLAGLYTYDGVTVYAIAANEFQGHRRPWLCQSRQYRSCWYGSIISARSENGGKLFTRTATGPAGLIVAPAGRYIPDYGRRMGTAGPSNILAHDGFFYFTFSGDDGGVCLARTEDLAQAYSWYLWDGSGFSVRAAVDPYENPEPRRLCKRLGNLVSGSGGTIVWVDREGMFIIVQIAGRSFSPVGPGVYYSRSKDLITWTKPRLLIGLPTYSPHCGDDAVYMYPSIIDASSHSRSFDTLDHLDADLYLVRIAVKDCRRVETSRQLVKFKVHLTAG